MLQVHVCPPQQPLQQSYPHPWPHPQNGPHARQHRLHPSPPTHPHQQQQQQAPHPSVTGQVVDIHCGFPPADAVAGSVAHHLGGFMPPIGASAPAQLPSCLARLPSDAAARNGWCSPGQACGGGVGATHKGGIVPVGAAGAALGADGSGPAVDSVGSLEGEAGDIRQRKRRRRNGADGAVAVVVASNKCVDGRNACQPQGAAAAGMPASSWGCGAGAGAGDNAVEESSMSASGSGDEGPGRGVGGSASSTPCPPAQQWGASWPPGLPPAQQHFDGADPAAQQGMASSWHPHVAGGVGAHCAASAGHTLAAHGMAQLPWGWRAESGPALGLAHGVAPHAALHVGPQVHHGSAVLHAGEGGWAAQVGAAVASAVGGALQPGAQVVVLVLPSPPTQAPYCMCAGCTTGRAALAYGAPTWHHPVGAAHACCTAAPGWPAGAPNAGGTYSACVGGACCQRHAFEAGSVGIPAHQPFGLRHVFQGGPDGHAAYGSPSQPQHRQCRNEQPPHLPPHR